MMTKAFSYDRERLKELPEDIEDQLKNEEGVPLEDMGLEAFGFVSKLWEPEIDGKWPPERGTVVRCYMRGKDGR